MKDLLPDDEDEMAIKFKKFKKAKENSKKKNPTSPKTVIKNSRLGVSSLNRSKHPPEAAMKTIPRVFQMW